MSAHPARPLLLAAFILYGTTASAATVCVAPGGANGCFASIQSAIGAAQPGDTVLVHAGEYAENLVVSKPLTLAGEDRHAAIIRPAVSNPDPCTGSSLCGGTASTLVLVEANDVTIHDLTLDGDNPALTSAIVRGGADLDARNGIVTNYLAGVFTNLVVHDVTVRNIYLRGIYAASGGTFDFHHNRVDNVQGDYYSIAMFNFGGSGTFAFNDVSRANDAISSNWSTGVQFLNNTIEDSASGIHTDNSSGGDVIAGNRVSDGNVLTLVGSSYGIWTFVPYAPVTIRDNRVEGVDVALASFGQDPSLTDAGAVFSNNIAKGRNAGGTVGAYATTDQLGWGSASLGATFTGNSVSGFADGFILVSDPANTITVSATCNDIRSNTRSVTTQGEPDPVLSGVQAITFHENNIKGAGAGLTNQGAGTIDAQQNWWGCPGGPSAKECSGTVGDVDASLWLAQPAKCALGGDDK